MGGPLAQLVAARTRSAGVVAACLQPRPWAKPLHPPTWQRFRRSIANTQTEEVACENFADLVCESGRACCEIFRSPLDRRNSKPPSTSLPSPLRCS
ncbi:hypothetical protein [Mycobacterium pseudokansasii]|uniref:Uncharacterized protein n=1 Tax=Mycobacterium pseudokansasii TaxID=2341080 RepID=A0A498QPZ0_9MYCO|nr:hypothetical protein [Mycobacterium pseudokansasii]VBA48214.1 hypothetical protein LAUMK142_01193 [Mycobacterium pseudokansasii]